LGMRIVRARERIGVRTVNFRLRLRIRMWILMANRSFGMVVTFVWFDGEFRGVTAALVRPRCRDADKRKRFGGSDESFVGKVRHGSRSRCDGLNAVRSMCSFRAGWVRGGYSFRNRRDVP